jgi:hypothetical protein
MAGDSVQTVSYGIGQGGKPFPRTSFTEIGFRGGKYVDCILLESASRPTNTSPSGRSTRAQLLIFCTSQRTKREPSVQVMARRAIDLLLRTCVS